MMRERSRNQAVAAWAATALFLAGGLGAGRAAWTMWRSYHLVASVPLAPDGAERAIPTQPNCEYRLVVRGIVRHPETGTTFDATQARTSGGSAWQHGGLIITPHELAPTAEFWAPHKQVYVAREGDRLPEGAPVTLRLDPERLGGGETVKGALQAELWRRNPGEQAPAALLLAVLGLGLLGVGALRVRLLWPRLVMRRPARGSEAERLLA